MKALAYGLTVCLLLAGCLSSNGQEFEGYYTYGHEVSSFRRCNGSEYFWLNGNHPQMDIIENESLSLVETKNEPYQSIYIKFSGFVEQREAVGFEDDYDGLIYMDELLVHMKQAPLSCK